MTTGEKGSIISIEDLTLVWRLFSKNWYLFIVLPALAAGIAFFYTHRLTDIYAAKTQILLKSEDVLDYSRNLSFYSTYESNQSQLRVLKSSDLIEDALGKLNLEVSYFIIGRIKVTEVYGSMPFVVVSDNFTENSIGKEFRLNIIDTSFFQLSFDINGSNFSKKYQYGDLILDNGLYITINKNLSLNDQSFIFLREINYMFKIQSRSDLVGKYKGTLEVKNLERTSVIEVSVEDELPQRAIAFLDSLSKVYIDYTLRNKIDVNVNTLNFINKQMEDITLIINDIETEIENYKETKSILNLTREEESFYRQLTDQESIKLLSERKLESLEELKNYLLNNTDEKFLPPSFFILLNDNFLKSSVTSLYELQMQRSGSLLRSTEKMLSIHETDQKMEQLRKNILIYMVNTKKFIENEQQRAIEQIAEYEDKIKNIPKTQRQLMNIERKLQINEKLYVFLLEKRAETIIARASIIAETKVIERARSMGIVRPDKNKIFLSLLSYGAGIALIISILRMLFYDRIETLKELTSSTKIPVLGGIPYSKEGDSHYVVVDSDPKAAITEAFRGIRTSLQYLSADKTSKVLLVTSLHSSEGKTFCASNLSTILARANKKTLLIDFDLHKPKVHKSLNIDASKGVSTYAISKTEYEESIIHTNIENLDVIIAGPIPPNASELVLSERIEQLLNKAKNDYQFIVLDTPPLGLISDAIVLMKFTDISIFVLHTKAATKQGLRFIEDVVLKSSPKSSALILNGIKTKRWRYYYGGYGYGYGYGYLYGYKYGYGYGYGADNKKAKTDKL